MIPDDKPLDDQRAARTQFLALVAEVRPDLHRYCARMTGSVTDGEDVVQETLARAYFMLPELPAMPDLRPWLFRVAHHRAIDYLRRYERRMSEPLEDDAAVLDETLPADDALARQSSVAVALARFVELPPIPRSAVILKDILGHSLDEIAALLELSLPAVKAALHRGRARIATTQTTPPPAPPAVAPSPELSRYIALFNARDWDGVRAMLADDVHLDVVSRAQRHGPREAGDYTTNYAKLTGWHLRPATLDGRAVIAAFSDATSRKPLYFIEISFRDGKVVYIRDYYYVRYITAEAALVLE